MLYTHPPFRYASLDIKQKRLVHGPRRSLARPAAAGPDSGPSASPAGQKLQEAGAEAASPPVAPVCAVVLTHSRCSVSDCFLTARGQLGTLCQINHRIQ